MATILYLFIAGPVAFFLEEDKPASSTTIIALGIVLLLAGLFIIYRAIGKLRQAGVVARLKETPIRDIGPGLTRIFGKVEGDNPLTSPVTGAQCYYYSALAQKRVGQGQKARWDCLHQATEARDFYLNDGTGRVLVHPTAADFDLTGTLEAKLGPESGVISCRTDPSSGLPQPTEQELRFLLKWDWQQPRAIAMAAAAAAGTGEEQGKKKSLWKLESIEIGGVEMSGSEAQEFSISETCLLAGQEYSIAGTCEEVSAPGGGFVVKQGTFDKTFAVSSGRGNKMVSSLRKKALIALGCGLFAAGFGIMMLSTSGSWVSG